jgi:hypothetical protein
MIIDLNIRHYRDPLKSEADLAKRRTITDLLAEEEVKLAGLVSEDAKITPRAPRANGSGR